MMRFGVARGLSLATVGFAICSYAWTAVSDIVGLHAVREPAS
jgi:hypothetical protein